MSTATSLNTNIEEDGEMMERQMEHYFDKFQSLPINSFNGWDRKSWHMKVDMYSVCGGRILVSGLLLLDEREFHATVILEEQKGFDASLLPNKKSFFVHGFKQIHELYSECVVFGTMRVIPEFDKRNMYRGSAAALQRCEPLEKKVFNPDYGTGSNGKCKILSQGVLLCIHDQLYCSYNNTWIFQFK